MSPAILAQVNIIFDIWWGDTASSFALYGFCLLYLGLALAIVTQRSILTLTGKRKANGFSPTGEGETGFSFRLLRAHANMYEAFPFWGLLLLAVATNQTAATDGLALYCLGARMAQVAVHLTSTSEGAVKLRFGFFVAQLAIFGYWLIGFSMVWFT